MFLLSDQTRRFVTQLIFVLFGPMLLASTLGLIFWSRTSASRQSYERFFSKKLEKKVQIGKVRFPKPGMVKFSDFKIIEPETEKTLLVIPKWELQKRRDFSAKNDSSSTQQGILAYLSSCFFSHEQDSVSWQLTIPYLATQARSIPILKKDFFTIFTQSSSQNVTFVISEADVFFAPTPDWDLPEKRNINRNMSSLTLAGISGEYQTGKKTSELSLQFRFAGQTVPNSPRCLVVQEHGTEFKTTSVFSSGELTIPTEFLSLFSPFFRNYGPRCHFQGDFQTKFQHNKETEQSVQRDELRNSVFSHVDLGQFMKNYVGFEITGELEQLWLKTASFTNGTIEQIEGSVNNGSGVAQQSGLIRLIQRLGLAIEPQLYDQMIDKPVAFKQCTFSFQFSSVGVRFGTLAGRPLMQLAPNYNVLLNPKLVRYEELLASLSSSYAPQVPMTRQSRELIAILPGATPLDAVASRPTP